MDQINREDLRRRVEEQVRVDRRNSRIGMFIANLMMFIFFMAVTWGTALSQPVFQAALNDSHSQLMTILILPTIGWGTALFFHLLAMLMDFGIMDRQFRDRAIAKALREEIFQDSSEKAKRQMPEGIENVRLSDDGELLPAEDADYKVNGKGTRH